MNLLNKVKLCQLINFWYNIDCFDQFPDYSHCCVEADSLCGACGVSMLAMVPQSMNLESWTLNLPLQAPPIERHMDHMMEMSTPSRRLAVLQGHLKSASSCVNGVRANTCGAGSKAAPQSSAPMSSSKDEVQKAFPRQRWALRSVYVVRIKMKWFGYSSVNTIIW